MQYIIQKIKSKRWICILQKSVLLWWIGDCKFWSYYRYLDAVGLGRETRNRFTTNSEKTLNKDVTKENIFGAVACMKTMLQYWSS